MGYYHDSISGALVSYDIGKMAGRYVDSYRKLGAPMEGTIAGLPYTAVVFHDAYTLTLENLRAEIGPAFPRPGTLDSAMLPPQGADGLVLTLGKSMNFRAWVCGESETSRVWALLKHAKSIQAIGTSLPAPGNGSLSIDALKPGLPIDAVVQAWAPAGWVYRPDCRRLAVPFPEWPGVHPAATVIFSAGGTLTEVQTE